MKISLQACIGITSVVVLLYVILSTLSVAFPVIFYLLMLSQALLIWMVVRILKDKRTSEKTFETHFYEDVDIRRE